MNPAYTTILFITFSGLLKCLQAYLEEEFFQNLIYNFRVKDISIANCHLVTDKEVLFTHTLLISIVFSERPPTYPFDFVLVYELSGNEFLGVNHMVLVLTENRETSTSFQQN
jgi:hypothetical protein